MGHAEFTENKNSGIVGKLAHKLNKQMDSKVELFKRGDKSYKMNSRKAATIFGYGLGIKSGVEAARKEKQGEKQNLVERLGGDLTILGANLPRVAKEIEASRKGMDFLKEAGANKKILKSARKNLAIAGSTYVLPVVGRIGISEGIRAVSKQAEKLRLKRKNNETKT